MWTKIKTLNIKNWLEKLTQDYSQLSHSNVKYCVFEARLCVIIMKVLAFSYKNVMFTQAT